MTTTVTHAFVEAVANGVTPIPFNFQAIGEDEVGVRLDGVELNYVTDYTVSLNGDGTGSVIPNASWATGAVLIYSKPTLQQPANFDRFAPFYPDQFNPPLDRLARGQIALADDVSRTLRFQRGQLGGEFDKADFVGKFLAGDANGDIVPASGPGSDPDLRTDIASATGATLVGTVEGGSLADVVARPRPLKLGDPKPTARTWGEARTMAADLSDMEGYAADALTTGGAGQTEYWVTNASDDPSFEGSFRWAVDAAVAGGGGMILFDPNGTFDITLRKVVIVGASALNVANITIDAPGRNVTIRNMPTIEGVRLSGQNIIVRRIRFATINGEWVDGEERDTFGINPLYTDKFWVNECEIDNSSDGAADVASSGLSSAAVSTASGYCRGTYTHNIFRNQDKTILLGRTGTFTPVLGSTYRVLLTLHENWFHSCGQRCPSVSGNAFAHLVNNIIDLNPYHRQDGSLGAASGTNVRFGGSAYSEHDLYRALSGSGYQGIGDTGDPYGAYDYVGSAGEDGITLGSANTGYIPARPYAITPTILPAAGASREAWAEDIIALCGPFQTPFPRGQYAYVDSAPLANPDGRNIIPWGGGHYQLVEGGDRQAIANPAAAVTFPRGATKTIAADTITIEGGDQYFAVVCEGGVADTLSTINGYYDGALIGFRISTAAAPLTISNTGNIEILGGSLKLTDPSQELWLHYDTGRGRWLVHSLPAQSGAYTPAVTATLNCSALTLNSARYTRSGAVVAVSGTISGTITATGVTRISVGLPVASNFTTGNDVSGACGSAKGNGLCWSDSTTDLIVVEFNASATGAFTVAFTCQYDVK